SDPEAYSSNVRKPIRAAAPAHASMARRAPRDITEAPLPARHTDAPASTNVNAVLGLMLAVPGSMLPSAAVPASQRLSAVTPARVATTPAASAGSRAFVLVLARRDGTTQPGAGRGTSP